MTIRAQYKTTKVNNGIKHCIYTFTVRVDGIYETYVLSKTFKFLKRENKQFPFKSRNILSFRCGLRIELYQRNPRNGFKGYSYSATELPYNDDNGRKKTIHRYSFHSRRLLSFSEITKWNCKSKYYSNKKIRRNMKNFAQIQFDGSMISKSRINSYFNTNTREHVVKIKSVFSSREIDEMDYFISEYKRKS